MAKLIVALLQVVGILLWGVVVVDDGKPVIVRLVALLMAAFYTFATGWWLSRK